MISEIEFSNGFLSFWDTIAPYLKNYMKIKNLEIDTYDMPSLSIKSDNSRKSLISEFAFRILCWELENTPKKITNDILSEIQKQTYDYIEGFGDNDSINEPLSYNEIVESMWLKDSLYKFFSFRLIGLPTDINPLFKGCGFLDKSYGDIICRDALFEIKSVERKFHSPDMRQLLTYAALNSASKQYKITKLGLINPRRQVFFLDNIDDISIQISGKSSDVLFNEIISFASSGDISK